MVDEQNSVINKELQAELIPLLEQMLELCKKHNFKEGLSIYISDSNDDGYISLFSLIGTGEKTEEGEEVNRYLLNYTNWEGKEDLTDGN